ncbi:hypothetical protein EDD21DRAFT_391119 [Dissophora ornata]|nr:hypothetical protein EDD21DRAFT_391119 [Dissophora ornata]
MMESSQLTTPLAGLQTVEQARAELEARLVAIHNHLQMTQTIGLLFVKREEDLRNCFEQLQDLKDFESKQNHQQSSSDSSDGGSASEYATQLPLPEPLREQLALLDKEFREDQTGILELKSLIDAQLPSIEVQPPQNDAGQTGVLGPSALPSSALPAQTISKPRRHKVVVPSTPSINDAAFPVQIQEELLNQVRYWTSQAEMKEKLNQEYDTKITEMERIIDALNKQRRMREESDERQKEDQWNLELENQELRSQNTELQQQLSRAMHENSKVQKALSTASEQLEQFKDKEEKTAGQLEITKSRHEQDMSTMRKHTTQIQREKSDLMKRMEELQTTMTQQQQKLAKKATMEALALEQEKQEREEKEAQIPAEAPILIQAPIRLPSNDEIAPPPAPITAPSEPKMASLARETSFAHQQSIISELQSKLSQEITVKEQLLVVKEELLNEKEELVKILADREETIENLRMEGPMGGLNLAEHPMSSLAPVELGRSAQDVDSDQEGPQSLPLLRPTSPMHVGGLFAELAQAKSIEEPIKPAVEYKDQEAMTEPIESWIHTIPGLIPVLAPAPAPAVPGKVDIETKTIATNTDAKSLSDGATSTEVLSPPVSNAVQPEIEPKVLVDSTTSTDDLPKLEPVAQSEVETKTLIDSATSTDDLPVSASAPQPEAEFKTLVDGATSTDAKTLVDSTTSTEDLSTPAVAAAVAASAASAIASVSSQVRGKSAVSSAQRNRPLADIITDKSSAETKSLSALDSEIVTTPTVTGLEVAAVRLPETFEQIEQISQAKSSEPAFVEPYANEEVMAPEESKVFNNLEMETAEPVPRSLASDIPLDDERRHTCDMSQSIPDFSSQSAPPVPALPKDIISSRPVTTISMAEGQEFRVSFGSAFGDAGGSALVTGAIEPVYPSEHSVPAETRKRENSSRQRYQQYHKDEQDSGEEEQDQKLLSPGRPTTGPPSALLARAAARVSIVSDLDAEALNEPLTNTHGTNYSRHPLDSSYPPSQPLTYPPRAASIRSPSIRSEKRVASSSPPPPHSRPPMATGAATISATTRTAYTFSNSSSQVHVAQSQQSQYQHITDSSGVSIGRSRYRPSPSGSVSSMSTDYGAPPHGRRLSVSSNYDGTPTATDPTMIQIITQTMIGDYLWKYTRRPMASVISEKKHRRYFWVHPYTKTMYWSLNNPAADGSREQRAKSALIINVYQITDESPSNNSDLPNVSLLVQTSSRNLKLTAPTRQKHELWYQSLAYLLSRPTTPGADIATDNQTWSEVQAARGVTSDTLLTIRNEKTVRKKGSFNRLQSMFGRSKENSPSGSPRSGHAAVVAPGPGSSMSPGSSAGSVSYGAALTGAPGPNELISAGVNATLASGSASTLNSVVGYPGHMMNAQNAVGGYGTMNGGKIMSQATTSFGTNMSPKPRLTELQEYENAYQGEYNDEEDEMDMEGEDEDDGELPEHVRQCCDGKHDIGALHHH